MTSSRIEAASMTTACATNKALTQAQPNFDVIHSSNIDKLLGVFIFG